jgi:hypothetical protein
MRVRIAEIFPVRTLGPFVAPLVAAEGAEQAAKKQRFRNTT